MNTLIEEQKKYSLQPMLMKSLILHVSFVLFFLLKATFLPDMKNSMSFESAIKVDIVDLPDKIKEDVAATIPPPPVEKVKEVPQPKPIETKPVEKAVVIQDKKKQETEILNKIKQMNVLQQIKSDVEQEQKTPPKTVVKGNVISPGTELRGVVKNQFDAYLDVLNHHIKNNWQLPQWMSNSKFVARVVVFADSRGQITKRILEKSSGNKEFDEFALDAIDKSSPLPPPPGKFVDILQYQGIKFGFPE